METFANLKLCSARFVTERFALMSPELLALRPVVDEASCVSPGRRTSLP